MVKLWNKEFSRFLGEVFRPLPGSVLQQRESARNQPSLAVESRVVEVDNFMVICIYEGV